MLSLSNYEKKNYISLKINVEKPESHFIDSCMLRYIHNRKKGVETFQTFSLKVSFCLKDFLISLSCHTNGFSWSG